MTWDYAFRHVEDAISDQIDIPEVEDRYVFGVDWSHDIMCVTVLKDHNAVAIRRIQSQIAQRDLLLTLNSLWSPDSIWASIGGPNIEALQAEGLPIIPFTMNARSKDNLIQRLSAAFDSGTLSIVNVQTLIDQLQNYRVELLSSGLYKYYALPGIGDDCVISLALAWYGVHYSGTGISFV